MSNLSGKETELEKVVRRIDMGVVSYTACLAWIKDYMNYRASEARRDELETLPPAIRTCTCFPCKIIRKRLLDFKEITDD